MRKRLAPLALTLALALLSSCSTLRVFNPAYNSFDDGLALFNQGQFDAAIAAFTQSTFDDPNFAQAYLYLARSYISLGRWRAAIQPLRSAFRLAPYEARDEIMNLLIDAAFAAALNDPRTGQGAPAQDLQRDLL